jgi:23S rRNA (guanosine2251-2'-O)-methyltransferase
MMNFHMSKITLVLENIRSAWNVGAIMRTCDALGADLILVGYTARPIGKIKEKIKKTSIGAEDSVPWQYFEHPIEVLETYTEAQHFAIELDPRSIDIFTFLKQQSPINSSKDVYLWMGNEIHGVSQEVCAHSQAILHVPMNGQKESLNVATTAGIVGYSFYQKIKYI